MIVFVDVLIPLVEQIFGLISNLDFIGSYFTLTKEDVPISEAFELYMLKNFYNIKLNPLSSKMLNFWENEFDHSSCVVIVFPDHGSRYLSKIYSDEWMNNQGFYDSSFYQPKKNSINYI